MTKTNIYKSPTNIEIHKYVEESSVSSDEDIKILLKSRYTKSQISAYLDFRYHENYLNKLNYPFGKTPIWVRILIYNVLGVGLLILHYLWLDQIDFIGSNERIDRFSPARSLEYTVLFGIGYYGSFYIGIALLFAPYLFFLKRYLYR